jgi:predicted alpha/beta-hydrolase family hydrolase
LLANSCATRAVPSKEHFIKKFLSALCLALSTAFIATAPHAAETATDALVNLKKQNGTTLRYLLTAAPGAGPTAGRTGVVLFAGSQGEIHLDQGIPRPGVNFLVRSRGLFAQEELVVAVFDPSTDTGALSDRARMSPEHAQEVSMVINDLRQRTGVSAVYLVGTSRGTISAAYLANALGSGVNGVVLTSTLFRASKAGAGLSGFDFATIKQPLLFVHNTEDQCKTTPPGYAKDLGTKYPLIWISGSTGELEEPCGPFSAHGYLGREKEAVHAIAEWIAHQTTVAPVSR